MLDLIRKETIYFDGSSTTRDIYHAGLKLQKTKTPREWAQSFSTGINCQTALEPSMSATYKTKSLRRD